MKIITHWVCEPGEEGNLVEKKFFATKGEEQTAAKASEKEGFQILAPTTWEVEPNAKAVAQFCNEQMKLKDYKDTQKSNPVVAFEESREIDQDAWELL